MSYEEYRDGVLNGLGYELEDLRNFERWRLRVLEQLNGTGGGGGSGSTALVTFKNSADSTSYTVVVVMADNTNGISISRAQIATAEGDGFPVPLYNGKMTLPLENFSDVNQTVMPTLTGDVTLDMDNGAFVITGDCSITLAGEN